MGISFDATCRECGKAFSASRGHGRRFQQLRCDACGDTLLVGHEEIADLHRRFMIAADKAGEIDDWEEGSRAFDRARDEFEEGVEASPGSAPAAGGSGTAPRSGALAVAPLMSSKERSAGSTTEEPNYSNIW